MLQLFLWDRESNYSCQFQMFCTVFLIKLKGMNPFQFQISGKCQISQINAYIKNIETFYKNNCMC